MTTPSIQYGYANGSANTVRPTSVTYPNGRVVAFDYGSSGGIDDSASRVASLVDSGGASTHLADYSYLGLNAVVQQDSAEADLRYTLVSLTGANDPDTGDIYAGLDRFGRVKDVRWRDVSAATDLSRIQYGYDRASNRTWRTNPTDPSQHYDWLYGYDGLQRLKTGNRGTLNGTQTAITSPQFGQCWTLDPTGNWSALQQSDDGTTWTMKQSRTSNPVNEITAINGDVGDLWATPRYDSNGNMTTIPRPDLNRPNWANLTADQWADLTKEEWAELEVAPKFTATYDAWNRLTKLVDAGNGQLVQENQYDGRNYRTVTKTYTNGFLVETRHQYYTDAWQCVEERLGSSTTPDRQFVWGLRYIDDLILRDRSVGGTLDERLYGCQDANWNLTAVVDDAGAVQERYEYDPYGDVMFLSPSFSARSASSYDWETLYAGYRWDAATGLYAVRNRYYPPCLGTWVTRDPLLVESNTLEAQYDGFWKFNLDMAVLNDAAKEEDNDQEMTRPPWLQEITEPNRPAIYSSHLNISEKVNLYSYCLLSPCVYSDSKGTSSGAAIGFGAGCALADGPLPIGDAVLVVIVVGVGIYEGVCYYKAHTKNKKKAKHEKGESRRGRDKGGEKGDERRKRYK